MAEVLLEQNIKTKVLVPFSINLIQNFYVALTKIYTPGVFNSVLWSFRQVLPVFSLGLKSKMLKILFSITLILVALTGIPFAAISQMHANRIHLEQHTFEASVRKLGEIFGVEIVLAGDHENFSNIKLNLNLEEASLEMAIKRILKNAHIQSHACIWDQEKNVLQVWVHRYHSDIVASKRGNSHNKQGHEPHDLNYAQMQQLSADDDFNYSPLTPEQIQQLNPYESNEKASKSLTKSQMQQLEQKEHNAIRTVLSEEQMRKLTPSKDLEKGKKGLSVEQMRVLRSNEEP